MARLSKHGPEHVGIIQSVEGLKRKQEAKQGRIRSLLELDGRLLLHPSIGTPGPQAFGLQLGLTLWTFLGLGP